MSKQVHPTSNLYPRLADIYALLTGVFGVLALLQLLDYQTTSFDLITLLPFTLLALIVSYFRIPLAYTNIELGLDGAVLIGAMLTAGPVIGGWAAFITGLVSGIRPRPGTHNTAALDVITQAALGGGRYVLATAAAWIVYHWLGSALNPPRLDHHLALALLLMFIVYVLARTLLAWPVELFKSASPQETLARIANINQVLFDLVTLLIAPLISPSFIRFGWTRFLTLALIFIGAGALMRRMAETIRALHEQLETRSLLDRVKQTFDAAQDTSSLCTLARQFCAETTSAKCEIGLYNDALDQITIFASEGDEKLPSMRLPVTPYWRWAGEQTAITRIDPAAQSNDLPFEITTPDNAAPPRALLCIPLRQADAPDRPSGAIILQSTQANAFDQQTITRIAALRDLFGKAMARVQNAPPPARQPVHAQLAGHIQRQLLPPRELRLDGWHIAIDWRLAAGAQAGGVYCHCAAANRLQFAIAAPQTGGLTATLAMASLHALFQPAPHNHTIDAHSRLSAAHAYLKTTRTPAALLYAGIDPENIFTLINAGFTQPLWWRSAQQHVEVLKPCGAMLGLDRLTTHEIDIDLAPRDVLVLYTGSLLTASAGLYQLIHDLETLAHLPARDLAAQLLAGAASEEKRSDIFVAVFRREEM